MATNYQAELVGCFGQPVAENPTGVMQEAGFRAAGLDWRYLTVEVAPEGLAAAVEGARAFGMRGFNLTIPHKVAVIEHLDALSEEARLIGAVNTVVRDGDRLIGENTDGKGFLRGLRQDAGFEPDGARVVVLGAGGAARAVATELLLAGVSDLNIVNRSRDRGEAMVADLQKHAGPRARFELWEQSYAVPAEANLLINATSIGLYPDVGAVPAVDFSNGNRRLQVADAVFNPPETRFLAAARERGLATLDGLSMLVYQGVIAFELWTGVTPDEAVMKRALREALEA